MLPAGAWHCPAREARSGHWCFTALSAPTGLLDHQGPRGLLVSLCLPAAGHAAGHAAVHAAVQVGLLPPLCEAPHSSPYTETPGPRPAPNGSEDHLSSLSLHLLTLALPTSYTQGPSSWPLSPQVSPHPFTSPASRAPGSQYAPSLGTPRSPFSKSTHPRVRCLVPSPQCRGFFVLVPVGPRLPCISR